VAINCMNRIFMQPMRSWTCTQEGSSFALGKGGEEFYNCCVLILFPCVPNDLSKCFPWALYDVPQVPNEFPKGVPNSSSLVWGRFSPSQLYRSAKGEGLHPHRNFYLGKPLKFQFLFFLVMSESKWHMAKKQETTIEKQSIWWIQ
jgi:hypothetical protein